MGTDNSRWGPGLENTVYAEAIRNPIHAFLPLECSICDMVHWPSLPCASQKTPAITFPDNFCVFGRFYALSPGLTHYFDPSRDSGV